MDFVETNIENKTIPDSHISGILSISSQLRQLKCGICNLGNEREELIGTCQCKGKEMKHKSCFKEWLETHDINSCEKCKTPYSIIRTPTTFKDWYGNKRYEDNINNIKKDIILLLFLISLILITNVLCIETIVFRKNRFSSIYLIILPIFLNIAYIYHLFMTMRYHWLKYKTWKETHWTIKFLEPFISGNQEDLQYDSTFQSNDTNVVKVTVIPVEDNQENFYRIIIQEGEETTDIYRVYYERNFTDNSAR
ncbi:E3 ubiquitin-protein ligase MARCH3-like [Centruroides sculpturatus]|uniref:E3 ubiquitin-protein ligase MARCH3-like n=1 Tax=Centruroides sculpturatus TaxID=218467 RepID=UPI000C6D9AD8|nr:E3 ubiquitin-protein ligase MARCH3-like [Centruroides sculpturatus]